ncbi:MAG TPA: hypothetical protein VEL48_09560 [Candidatus Acidoferrales bacterium]|nr:hypothetical protein [Candidatus Acidoferrales bacterium]
MAVVLALVAAASVALAADQGFEKLEGRWRRPDGGYVLDIRKVRPDGAIDVAYLNPRPINVSKAQASRDGATVRVFVELRAPNYPGSTYTLTYDSKRDELYGVYYQAVEGRSFDVVFVRMK